MTSLPPKLYYFIGAPGAGKTTLAQAIAQKTGGKHLWADQERHKLFEQPTHAQSESDELYRKLNEAADYLLEQGRSVIYDTNFNFYADRAKMRAIADKHGAGTVLIWLTTPNRIAKQRAVGEHKTRNGYTIVMTEQQFDTITSKLEPPHKDEKVIKIDGSELDVEAALALLHL